MPAARRGRQHAPPRAGPRRRAGGRPRPRTARRHSEARAFGASPRARRRAVTSSVHSRDWHSTGRGHRSRTTSHAGIHRTLRGSPGQIGCGDIFRTGTPRSTMVDTRPKCTRRRLTDVGSASAGRLVLDAGTPVTATARDPGRGRTGPSGDGSATRPTGSRRARHLSLAASRDLCSRVSGGWAVGAVNDRHPPRRTLELARTHRCPDAGGSTIG